MHRGSSRRSAVPWATCALLVAWVLGFLPTHLTGQRSLTQGLASLERAAAFHRAHPHLDVHPRAKGTLRPPPRAGTATAGPDRFRALEQVEFDGLALTGLDTLAASPQGRWGFAPARGSVVTLVTHLALHAGLLPLVANLLLLALVGPSLERAWGAGPLLALTLGAGIAGAVGVWLWEPGLAAPLVGATGGVAGAVGAFLILCGGRQVPFLSWLGSPFQVSAPGWILVPLWGARELLGILVPDVLAPAPAGFHLAAGSHAIAFTAGLLGGVALRWGGIEVKVPQLRRPVAAPPKPLGTVASPRPLPPTMTAPAPVLREAPKIPVPTDPPQASEPPRRPDEVLLVVPALPSGWTGTALTIETPTGTGRLDLRRVRAVATAAIEDGGAEANLVLDLVVRDVGVGGSPPRVLRCETRRFDPATAYPEMVGPEEAFRAFVEDLLAASGAPRLWPGVPRHPSVASLDQALAAALANPEPP